MKVFSCAIILTLTISLHAQPLELDPEVFARRRVAFMAQMDQDAVAIFPSKPTALRNLDVEYLYRQESNFYYLSGFEEPEAILLLNPSASKHRYVMFVRRRDPARETYDGYRAGVEGAMATFTADTALYIDEFASQAGSFVRYDRPVYYTFGINAEYDKILRENFVERRSRGNWPIIDPAPILDQMRLIKNDDDWAMGMKKTVEISVEAHIEAMKAIKSGMYEYEIQAVFEYVFRKEGSPRNGYPPIVGSGANSTILHYNENRSQLQDGDVILMDCGAEYGCYSADITRTVPVNGKFSNRQKEIYEIVLSAQHAAMQLVKPGVTQGELNNVINKILGKGLVRLGFIKDPADRRMFTLHGYSHWIGLEVHDVGAYQHKGEFIPLQPGMVFTIEPGIYVRPDVFDKMRRAGYSEDEIAEIRKTVEPYMHIGVRIEDDIVVTLTGYENLSKGVPREIEDIERLMKEDPTGF